MSINDLNVVESSNGQLNEFDLFHHTLAKPFKSYYFSVQRPFKYSWLPMLSHQTFAKSECFGNSDDID
jgi:hypothetical protein